MGRPADRFTASTRRTADYEIMGLLRQLIAEQQRTNALLQYLANAKQHELSQAARPMPQDAVH